MELEAKTPEQGVYLARIAEQAERYEDMIVFLKPVLDKADELTIEERNLLSVAYKNLSGSRRTAWRSLTQIEENPKYEKYKAKTTTYKKLVEEELKKICNDLIKLVDAKILSKAKTKESKTFYLKLKGDYYRYASEVCTAAELDSTGKKAEEAYKAAQEACSEMEATNPIKLGLSLNLSVFTYEILKKPKEACQLAKTAFDAAVSGIQSLPEDQYKEATSIMQLLKDNLTLWENEAGEPGEEGGDKAAAA